MAEMDVYEVLEHLPQRFPLLMIDRVTECEPGKRIVALKNVSVNEPYFPGHFPGRPLMPGVLQIEAMAQLAGVPAAVIRSARKRLAELEEHGMTPQAQRDLFASNPGEASGVVAMSDHPALGLLSDLKPDELSPKEALEVLYRLKGLAGD